MVNPNEINDILREPNLSNLAPYSPLPERRIPTDSPTPHGLERGMSVNQIYAEEMHDALGKAHFGGIDVLLAAKGVVGGAILGLLQSDMANQAARGVPPENYSFADSPLLWAASQPVDWKAVATAGAVFGVTSGVRRATRPYTVGADIEKTRDAIREGGELTPHTEATFKHFRRIRAVRDLGLTAAATGVAYEAGTQLTVAQNLMLGAGLTAVSGVRMGVAKLKYNRRGF